jgi:hypothetical protein
VGLRWILAFRMSLIMPAVSLRILGSTLSSAVYAVYSTEYSVLHSSITILFLGVVKEAQPSSNRLARRALNPYQLGGQDQQAKGPQPYQG